MTAVAATPATDPIVETVETRYVTATLTTTAEGWTITAISKVRPRGTYTCTIRLCDCRTDENSPRRQRYHGRQATCDRRDALHSNKTCMCCDNYGYRPLCPKPPQHNTTCHRTNDHCAARWHIETGAEAQVRQLFADVIASYRPARIGPDITDRRRVPSADNNERAYYADWLRENDPDATNPYAVS